MNDQTQIEESITISVYSRKVEATINLASDNRTIYEHLLIDAFVSKDLLTNFKTICVRDEVDITDIAEKTI
jgi:hypothetical protein